MPVVKGADGRPYKGRLKQAGNPLGDLSMQEYTLGSEFYTQAKESERVRSMKKSRLIAMANQRK